MPNGEGELVMRTMIDDATATDDEMDDSDDSQSESGEKQAADPNNGTIASVRIQCPAIGRAWAGECGVEVTAAKPTCGSRSGHGCPPIIWRQSWPSGPPRKLQS